MDKLNLQEEKDPNPETVTDAETAHGQGHVVARGETSRPAIHLAGAGTGNIRTVVVEGIEGTGVEMGIETEVGMGLEDVGLKTKEMITGMIHIL